MAVSYFGLISLPVLILLGSVAGGPLSGPPLPLDPAISAVAPQECVWYASAAGMAEADANSENQTEQLFAEPEMRHFSTELEKQLIRALRQSVGSSREPRVFATEIPKLLKTMLTRPLAVFVEDFQVTDDEFACHAGLVLNAGEQRETMQAAIDNLVELSLTGGVPIATINEDGSQWHIVRFSMQSPEIRWGWEGDYFILAVGDGTAEDILQRLSDQQTPDWLDELRENQTQADIREASLVYLNVERLLSQLRPMLEKEQAWPTVEKLGLTGLRTFHGWSGFDRQGCASHARLTTDGSRRGLLSFVPNKQLSDHDLKLVPEDALAAFVVRADLSDLWKNLLRLGEEFDRNAVERIEQNLRQVENKLGVNLEDDLIGSLDDVWTVHMPGGDLMTAWLGSAATVKVKDARRLRVAIKALIDDVRSKLPPGDRGPKIRESEFEGQTIYTLNFVGQPVPVSPAWCVTDDWFFFGLTPQTVRSLITRDDEPSLADTQTVSDVFRHSKAPTALAYLDTPALVRSVYPLVQMGGQMLSAQLQREGIEIDPTILPSSNAIIKHLRPSISIMIDESDGAAFYSRHSLPNGGGATMAPLAAGVMLPAVVSARAAAERVTSINNMRQIALAVLNYESAYGKLPNNIYDDRGRALLSWRVRLLPFMEQAALYDQFHLDEPWDSEHNKPLSETVLQVFTAPGSRPDGKTRYLALVGEKTLFPGEKEIGLAEVTDGTSNTILVVEAAPDAAVPWSKPADIEFNPQQPFRDIKSAQGRFAIAMNDGSCRMLQNATIDEDTMRALATRNGGEVIERPF